MYAAATISTGSSATIPSVSTDDRIAKDAPGARSDTLQRRSAPSLFVSSVGSDTRVTLSSGANPLAARVPTTGLFAMIRMIGAVDV